MKWVAAISTIGLIAFALDAEQHDRAPNPQSAIAAVIQAFDHRNIVMLGESHSCKQEYEWLHELVNTPEFADRVDDIVVEIGNSLYQEQVDRYVAGLDVPLPAVEPAWLDVVGTIGGPSPVYASFYKAVREANLKRPGQHQMRLVLGGPDVDWAKIKTSQDLLPFRERDPFYAGVVRREVLDKKRRALLIMGSLHFARVQPTSDGGWAVGPGYIERQLLADGASTYFIVFGTNVVGGYDDLDTRFDSWALPAVVDLRNNWVGQLPYYPVVSGGTLSATSLRLGDAADALLYIAPRDSLTALLMPRAELDGTAYGKELQRRTILQTGKPRDFLLNRPAGDPPERPLFERPNMAAPKPRAMKD